MREEFIILRISVVFFLWNRFVLFFFFLYQNEGEFTFV